MRNAALLALGIVAGSFVAGSFTVLGAVVMLRLLRVLPA